MMKNYFLNFKDMKIHFVIWEEQQPNKNFPIILGLHGLGSNALVTYRKLADVLSKNGFSFVAIDFPGFGDSSFSDQLLDEDFYKIICCVLNELNLNPINQIVLFAHSMGGIMALDFINKFSENILGYCSLEGNCTSGGGYISKKFARMDGKRLERFYSLFLKEIRKNPEAKGLTAEFVESMTKTEIKVMKYYSDFLVNRVPQNILATTSFKIKNKAFVFAPNSPEEKFLKEQYLTEGYLVDFIEGAQHDIINSKPEEITSWANNWLTKIIENEN